MGLLNLILVTLMCLLTAGMALIITALSAKGYYTRTSTIGLRTKALTASDATWREGNTVAFRVLLVLLPVSAVLITVQACAWLRDWQWDVFTVVSMTWCLALLWMTITATFLANRTAKKVLDRDGGAGAA